MGEQKISEMTPDDSVTGAEIIPASDGGVAKSVTVTNIKDFTVDQIEAISAGSSTSTADKIYILQGGALKPLAIDTVVQYALDTAWAKAAEASPAGADKLQLYDDDEGAENTITLTVLAEFVRSTIEAAILNVSDLTSGVGSLATTDYLLITQSGVGKQIQISDLSTLIYASLKTYVDALTSASAADGTEKLYCIQGGNQRELLLSQIATYVGNTFGAPASTTTNNIPQWSNGTGSLKDGLGLATAIADPGVDTQVASEKAVRDALNHVETIWLPANLWTPHTTAGCGTETHESTTNKNNVYALLFAGDTANEKASCTVVFPDGWDADTFRAKVCWMPAHADANANEWVRFIISGRAYADDDDFDQALGTAKNLDDQAIADDDIHWTDASDPIIVGGSPARGQLIVLELERDYDYNGGTGAAMDVDARVLGVLLQIQLATNGAAWT